MKTTIPETMKTILLETKGGPLTIGEIPIPKPGAGQILVRMAASPINPSDLGFLQGGYGFNKPFPLTPGFEGSGTVIGAGSGLLPRLSLGRRVVCSAPSGGTWAEYLVTSAVSCFPLSSHLSLEQGATLIVNPMTALAFIDIAKRDHHTAIISNAAASALGRMILRLGQSDQIPIIHIVRKQEQVDLLRSLGGKYILNSSVPDFYDQLHRLAHQLKATLILDPVAGEQAQRLLDAVPNGSTLLIYGTLSGNRIDVSHLGSQANGKRAEGFFLPNWMAKKNILQVLMDARRVQHLAPNELQTTIQKRFPLSAIHQAIELYRTNPTSGKILLVADLQTIQVD